MTRLILAMVWTRRGQAVTLAYVDTFALLARGGILMFLLAFLLKKNDFHTGGKRPVE